MQETGVRHWLGDEAPTLKVSPPNEFSPLLALQATPVKKFWPRS